MSASRRRETLLNFGLGGIEGCARNLVGGRGRVRRRLQLGAGVLRDVGEIGRQSWRPNGRRFGLGSIVGWFGHGFSPERCEANQGQPLFVPEQHSVRRVQDTGALTFLPPSPKRTLSAPPPSPRSCGAFFSCPWWHMQRMTSMERAFHLARSGRFTCLTESSPHLIAR